MSGKTRMLLGTWLIGLALLGTTGCGSGKETTPPESDAVTTEPLNIEMPGEGEGAAGDAQKSEPAANEAAPKAE